MNAFRRIASVLCLTIALSIGLSATAQAGAPAADGCGTGLLFTPAYGTCVADTQHIFSNFVCQYEKIVSEIMSELYCGMQESLLTPLYLVLTLFVTLLGAAILIGTTQVTAREMMLVLFKIGLVIAFATRAEFMIDILYKGLVGFITGGVDLVMKTAGDQAGGSANGLLDNIDKMINKLMASVSLESSKATTQKGGNQCTDSPIPLLATFMVSAPPLFALGAMMAMKLLFVFIRAVVGYLFSLTIIMFLVSLAPIFLSLGLFHVTRNFFQRWVEYLMSSAIQIVVVFAFIGFILSMGIEQDFAKLVNISAPFNDNMWQEGQRQHYNNTCSIHENVDMKTGTGTGAAIPPSGMWRYPDVLKFVGTEMFKLLLLAMLVEQALNLAPEIARQLGGVQTAPALGGSTGGQNDIPMMGSGALGAAGRGLSEGFASGRNVSGSFGNALSRGYQGLMGGDATTGNSGIFTEVSRGFFGLR